MEGLIPLIVLSMAGRMLIPNFFWQCAASSPWVVRVLIYLGGGIVASGMLGFAAARLGMPVRMVTFSLWAMAGATALIGILKFWQNRKSMYRENRINWQVEGTCLSG